MKLLMPKYGERVAPDLVTARNKNLESKSSATVGCHSCWGFSSSACVSVTMLKRQKIKRTKKAFQLIVTSEIPKLQQQHGAAQVTAIAYIHDKYKYIYVQIKRKVFFTSMKEVTERVSFDWKLFAILAAINCGAVVFNHIDDTDETYGYWEPLHYLLYGKGMQTWEYDPDFAIRSYAFVFPLFVVGNFLRGLGIEKIVLFYVLRSLIGLFSTFSQYSLLKAISLKYENEKVAAKQNLARMTAVFLILSPGVFYAGTSFLPSAISMTLTMLSLARWLEEKLPESIFWGSAAVLGTGWPFVGLIYLPLGLHMLSTSFHVGGIFQIFKLCLYGIVVVLLILLPVTTIDFLYYQKPTIPFWNILTYNTGNRGDELYGIEPASYYLKNLLLTTGLAFPLACLVPLSEILQLFLSIFIPRKFPISKCCDSYMMTMYVSAALWLGVLFSRPHKEERFLYPVYPLLAFSAARSLLNIFDGIRIIIETLIPQSIKSKSLIGKSVLALLYRFIVMIMLIIFSMRIFANVRNYYGYLASWNDLNSHLLQSEEYLRLSKIVKMEEKNNPIFGSSHFLENNVRVCVGSEWHLFPTHFFLPSVSSLYYIEDGFHGILPQHYAAINGTFARPPLPNNGENREELSRYINIDDCHYIVTSKVAKLSDGRLVLSDTSKHLKIEVGKDEDLLEIVGSRPVLNRDDSTASAILRAFYVPSYFQSAGEAAVSFKSYRIYKIRNSIHAREDSNGANENFVSESGSTLRGDL